LCNGSGMLCVGLMSDPCPLCYTPEDENDGDERPEAQSSSSSHGAPPSDAGVSATEEAIQDVVALDGCTECDASKALCINIVKGTRMTAPPGLGPPGTWVWPYECELSDDEADPDTKAKSEHNAISWPQNPVNNCEVEFVGKAAQLCFGPDFVKMEVTWATPWVEAQTALSIVNVELDLKPNALASSASPLAKLQAVLARDQKFHECHISRMECSKDGASMHLTCTKVGIATCWDVLKLGFCPRSGCTWEHRSPTMLNVSCIGVPTSTSDTPLPTLLMPKAGVDVVPVKVQNKDNTFAFPLSAGTMGQQMNNFQLNFGAFESDSDDSSV